MSNYNTLKKLISYLNFLFAVYFWIIIIYAFFRYTNLLKSSPLGEIILFPIKFLIDIF